jgi:hypothetical protein
MQVIAIVTTTGPMPQQPGRYRSRNNTRGWSEGDIKDLARQAAEDVLRGHLTTLDRLADGAQASINTALLLHGDSDLGIKGAIPEIRDRLALLEDKIGIVALLEEKVDELRAHQGRMMRACKRAWSLILAADEEGKPAIRRLVALSGVFGGIGYGLNWFLSHLQMAKEWLARWIWK